MAFCFAGAMASHAAFISACDFIFAIVASVKNGAILLGSSRAPAKAEPLAVARAMVHVKNIFLIGVNLPYWLLIAAEATPRTAPSGSKSIAQWSRRYLGDLGQEHGDPFVVTDT